jgi:hypothetical protein
MFMKLDIFHSFKKKKKILILFIKNITLSFLKNKKNKLQSFFIYF